jgi:ribonucleoside-diphosphate reductase alpha chain
MTDTTPLLDPDTLQEPLVSDNALAVLENRYLAKNDKGEVIETPKEMYIRVATTVAMTEPLDSTSKAPIDGVSFDQWHSRKKWARKFYDMMAEGRFVPNCISIDTPIATTEGLCALSELSPTLGTAIDIKVVTDEKSQSATQYFDNGPKNAWNITTTSGYTITATPEHNFRVIDIEGNYVWKALKDIDTQKDFLCLQKDFIQDFSELPLTTSYSPKDNRSSVLEKFPATLTPQLAEFLGYTYGDGTFRDNDTRIAVFEEDEDIVEWLCLFTKKAFNLIATFNSIKDKKCSLVSLNNKALVTILQANGLRKKTKDKQLCIPDIIKRSNREVISSFLRGLFEADGTVGERTIEFYSCSLPMVQDVHFMLLGLGIVSQYKTKDTGYKVVINKDINGRRYAERIGFTSIRKQTKVKSFLTPKHEKEYVPNQAKRLLSWYKSLPSNLNLYKKIARFVIETKYQELPSKSVFIKYSEEFSELTNCYIFDLFQRNQFYDTIASVEKVTVKTADLSVPQNNTFIAGGFVTHNSPTMMNAGRKLGLLSACFVIPVEDDIEGIFDSVKATALIQRAGGGVGYDFSLLRPNRSIVKSSGGTTAGPLSFVKVLSETTTAIQQGAFRRGASMGCLRIDHPDIIDFINCKQDLSKLQNFNLSVVITDEFMKCLDATPTAYHRVVHKEWGTGALFCNSTTHEVRAFTADNYPDDGWRNWHDWTVKDTWDLICKRAHATGEPGILFIDKANKDNPLLEKLGPMTATNPCVAGDTQILTVNGPVAIKELADKKEGAKVITYDPRTKQPVVRMARDPRRTRINTEFLELEFDSGLKLKCTPNHNLHDLDGNKVQAQDIKVGQSVLAFSVTAHSNGQLKTPSVVANHYLDRWISHLAWECDHGAIPVDQMVVHIDGDIGNNNADNLELRTVTPKIKEMIESTPETVETNHKVVGVKQLEKADAYNITVDGAHTYIIVDPVSTGGNVWSGIVSCNCGEQWLYPFESCTLGSINLSKMIADNYIDKDLYKETIATATRFLDNVIDVNNYPLQEIRDAAVKTRRIGLGVMGWADYLYQLDISYDSTAARDEAVYLADMLTATATKTSFELGQEKGPYPLAPSYTSSPDAVYRNSFTTTIAPTGTCSIIANCSGGIEPLFALSFTRQIMKDDEGKATEMCEVNPYFLEAIEGTEFRKLILTYAKKHGNIQNFTLDHHSPTLEALKNTFVTSHDISPESHVLMQAAWQKHIDNSISKTVNMSHDATVKEVADIFSLAYKNNCKGVTVYRDGCRDGLAGMVQPMIVKKDASVAQSAEHEICNPEVVGPNPTAGSMIDEIIMADKSFLPAIRTSQSTPFGSLHVHITIDPVTHKEVEIFAQLGKGGDNVLADLEALCRIASKYLKVGGTLEEIAGQLLGIGSSYVMPSAGGKIHSVPDALGKVINNYLTNKNLQTTIVNKTQTKNDLISTAYGTPCPGAGCNGKLIFQEGCQRCPKCGYSAC